MMASLQALPWLSVLALALAAVAMVGLAQAALGWVFVRTFARTQPVTVARADGVTVLKPLHGDEPLLEEALRSFLAQSHAELQIVFGVQRFDDTALDVVDALMAEFPERDIAVVVDPRTHGRNRKICNLTNMMSAARHDVLLIADSDVHAAPDLVAKMLRTLWRPGVGLVTSLYAGLPASGSIAGKLAAMQISSVFLPGAVLARRLGRQDCLGATMMLRRETLEAVGGLAALSPHLADDAVLGRLVRARGLRVALAPVVPLTTVPEVFSRDVYSHELRWFRTVRALEPVGFAASVLQYPVAFALAAFLITPSARAGMVFASVWMLRALLARATHAALRPMLPVAAPAPATWLWPLRETLSLFVMAMSYGGHRVSWRGHHLVADAGRPALLPRAVFDTVVLKATEGLV